VIGKVFFRGLTVKTILQVEVQVSEVVDGFYGRCRACFNVVERHAAGSLAMGCDQAGFKGRIRITGNIGVDKGNFERVNQNLAIDIAFWTASFISMMKLVG